jgi:hypothetical protein
MNKGMTIEKTCAETDAFSRTRAKRCPPPEVPQRSLQPTSQNPQERRYSLPEERAALLSFQTRTPTPGPMTWFAGGAKLVRWPFV